MKYASTFKFGNNEKVVVVLPLSQVPQFDSENPHENTYCVDDDVQVGWIKNGNKFEEPTEIK